MTKSKLLPLTAVLAAFLVGIGAADAQVVINEVLADPARDWDGDGAVDSAADEWVEVLNTGSTPVDLAGYWLKDDAADNPRMGLVGVLEPGQVAVFFGSDALAWQAAHDAGSGGLSLNNGGDTVHLLRTVPGSDPLAVEPADSAAYPSHVGDDDRSCGWDTFQGEWVLFDALKPYGGDLVPTGTGCAPTPGLPNLCHGQVGAERVSFGGAKARFR